jgi:pimeloyl-ACP methyl ester carboxylesterase
MTASKPIKPGPKAKRRQLVAISASHRSAAKKEDRRFKTGGDGYLWSTDILASKGGWRSRKDRADGSIPLPLQLHYLPIDERLIKPKPKGDRRPVLLLHGASAGSDTFLAPSHGGGCFVDYLISENYEPWLLDWRASKDVADTMIMLRDGEDIELGLTPDLDAWIKNAYRNGGEEKLFDQLNFNLAAANDIKRALDAIKEIRPGRPIDIVAHCMGAAIMAEALVSGKLAPGSDHGSATTYPIAHVVLSTIGVFYQMNFHGRLKAEAHLLKRVQGEEKRAHRFLDPRTNREKTKDGSGRHLPKVEWPPFIETLYETWNVTYDRKRLERDRVPKNERYVFEMFNRLSFMYGEPYQEGNLAPEIHHRLQALVIKPLRPGDGLPAIPAGAAIRVGEEDMGEVAYAYGGKTDERFLVYRSEKSFEPDQILSADGQLVGKVDRIDPECGTQDPLLPGLFGPMSLDLFRHGAENLRAGVATTLEKGREDRKKSDEGGEPTPVLNGDDEGKNHAGFEELDGLTLIGGGLNRLWHRDCIDRMADWLDRSQALRERCRKIMLLDYGHQDLYWGRDAARDVFPKIVEGLGPNAPDNGRRKAG